MNAYLEIIRPGNALMAAIAVILMMFVGHYYDLPIIFTVCFIASYSDTMPFLTNSHI